MNKRFIPDLATTFLNGDYVKIYTSCKSTVYGVFNCIHISTNGKMIVSLSDSFEIVVTEKGQENEVTDLDMAKALQNRDKKWILENYVSFPIGIGIFVPIFIQGVSQDEYETLASSIIVPDSIVVKDFINTLK